MVALPPCLSVSLSFFLSSFFSFLFAVNIFDGCVNVLYMHEDVCMHFYERKETDKQKKTEKKGEREKGPVVCVCVFSYFLFVFLYM